MHCEDHPIKCICQPWKARKFSDDAAKIAMLRGMSFQHVLRRRDEYARELKRTWRFKVCQLDQPSHCYGGGESFPEHLQSEVPPELEHLLYACVRGDSDDFERVRFRTHSEDIGLASTTFKFVIFCEGWQINQQR